MATIPYDASERLIFIPASLRDLESPPTFRLKYGTRRDRRRLEADAIELHGLRQHSQESIRQAILDGLKSLLTAAEYAEYQPLFESYWDASDDYAEAQKDKPFDERTPFEFPDEDKIKAVYAGVKENWKPLREMMRDNHLASIELPSLVVSATIVGWDNLDITITRDDQGHISGETLDRIEQQLEVIADKNGINKTLPFGQLQTACSAAMYLDKEQAKNFVSPPPSPEIQSDTENGAASTNGTSKASKARSKKTPES